MHLFDLPPLLSAPGGEDTATVMETFLGWLLTHGVRIVVILVIAALLRVLAGVVIRRIVKTMVGSGSAISSVTQVVVRRGRQDAEAIQARRTQRAETLGNVSVNIASVVISAVALVMILSEIGVNIAPVIASLGVVGLAAGIGAQTIIKDTVAGVVMLAEDTLAVGDWVDVEYAEGTVTNINLRMTQVRSLDGTLWTVRNGEIIRVGNKSRGYSNAVVLLDMDDEADNTVVTEALESVVATFAADEDWAPLLQGEISISGILEMDGTHFRRRMIAQTAPGRQWDVERELRYRVRTEFAARGIALALPQFAETTTA